MHPGAQVLCKPPCVPGGTAGCIPKSLLPRACLAGIAAHTLGSPASLFPGNIHHPKTSPSLLTSPSVLPLPCSFWNFDALFQPQQHPARDAHDTFFLTSEP